MAAEVDQALLSEQALAAPASNGVGPDPITSASHANESKAAEAPVAPTLRSMPDSANSTPGAVPALNGALSAEMPRAPAPTPATGLVGTETKTTENVQKSPTTASVPSVELPHSGSVPDQQQDVVLKGGASSKDKTVANEMANTLATCTVSAKYVSAAVGEKRKAEDEVPIEPNGAGALPEEKKVKTGDEPASAPILDGANNNAAPAVRKTGRPLKKDNKAKETAPVVTVGKTLRKTRSQGPVDA